MNLTTYTQENPIVINFIFEVDTDPTFGLDSFTTLEIKFGEEVYTQADTDVVTIVSNTQLSLNLGNTSEMYASYLVINGYNTTYPEGYQLTSKCLGNLDIPHMC